MDILSLLEQYSKDLQHILKGVDQLDRPTGQLAADYYQSLQEKIDLLTMLLPCLEQLDKNAQSRAAQLCSNLQKQLQPAIAQLKTMHQETAKQLQQLAPLVAQSITVAQFVDTKG